LAEELNKPNEQSERKDPAQPEPGSDHVSTPEELEAIRAQLTEEQAVLAEAQAQLTEREDRIAALETELLETRATLDAGASRIGQLEQARDAAVGKYLAAVKASNPALPAEAITGRTIDEIDASLATAQSIAGAVRASLEAEAKHSRVPAGAPTRVLDLDSLTPTEKIKLGLSTEKGGTS
jgi:chromosome segregation ATPase